MFSICPFVDFETKEAFETRAGLIKCARTNELTETKKISYLAGENCINSVVISLFGFERAQLFEKKVAS